MNEDEHSLRGTSDYFRDLSRYVHATSSLRPDKEKTHVYTYISLPLSELSLYDFPRCYVVFREKAERMTDENCHTPR